MSLVKLYRNNKNIKHYSVNASDEISTVSITDVAISGMSISLNTGTYKVEFNANYDTIPGNMCTMAVLDLQNLYLALVVIPVTDQHGLTFGSGEVLPPGVYNVAGAMSVAGILTLDGGGDPNALFVFKVNGALNTALATTIQLSNKANAANVFFLAIGAVGVGADNVISGNFISYGAAAALGANCIFTGRLFSTGGALAFATGILKRPTAISVLDVGSLASFLCFTNSGDVTNTALATITGDLATNDGNVAIYTGSVLYGNIYTSTQPLGNVSTFSLYIDNSIITNSDRDRTYDKYTKDIALMAIATINGTQSISVNWKTNVGKVMLRNRILTIIKL